MGEYIKALEGISYSEWMKLRMAVDRAFEYQKSEFENKLKLANVETVKSLIRSQFGCALD